MDVKEAAAAAKKHLFEIMAGDAIEPPALEEIWLDENKAVWFVTLGVRRLSIKDIAGSAASRLGLARRPDYKIVTIADADGRAISIRDRLFQTVQE